MSPSRSTGMGCEREEEGMVMGWLVSVVQVSFDPLVASHADISSYRILLLPVLHITADPMVLCFGRVP